MSTVLAPTPVVDSPDPVLYPSSDGMPMGETTLHVKAITDLYCVLQAHFATSPDVFVAANLLLYYEEGNPKARKTPDVMVVKGVDKRERRSFFTWVEKRVPAVVFEFISEATWEEDLVNKKDVYAQLGVSEYFLYDPYAEYLTEPLLGYQLKGQRYAELPHRATGLNCQELGLRLIADGPYLRVIDAKSGTLLAHAFEVYERQLAAEAEAARLRALLQQLQEQAHRDPGQPGA